MAARHETRAGWREEYQRKLVSFEGAAALIHRGDIMHTPIGGDARSFMPAVFNRIMELDFQVKVRACAPAAQDWFLEEYAGLPWDIAVDVYGGPNARAALASRRSDFYPQLFSNEFNLYDSRGNDQEPIDVFATYCTPPDEDGYVTFGGQPWHKGDFARRARTCILEVSPWAPNVRTTERLHVSEVAAFVMTTIEERPQVAVGEPPPGTEIIAGFVNEVLEDGDTIQIGAGRTATRLVTEGAFEGKRDLGWHSEITPIGVIAQMMSGVVNNTRKTVDRGLGVTTSVTPRTPEEERWLVEEGLVETRGVREVNAIPAVAAQEQMVAINNAFMVDLTGQICSEALGTTVYNGTGGQPEFHIGAFIAPRGKAITVLPSAAGGGHITRIIPRIEDGSFVTVTRSFADHVITEHGIARLGGRSQRQRAENLIAIAHPDHRGELRRAMRTYFYPGIEAALADGEDG
ncbi:MAG: acetyl-CoA hydrolase/transferase C-terminal domain-containing protein [Dehalococcoidia bacterium]